MDITLKLTIDQAQRIVNAIATPYLEGIQLIDVIRAQVNEQIVKESSNVEQVHSEGNQEAGEPEGNGEA